MGTSKFTIEQIANAIEQWLVSGVLNTDILSQDFIFKSPFWAKATKNEFIKKFKDPSNYEKVTLSKITKFDPAIIMYDVNQQYFSIVLTYHTRNNYHVDECVLGTIKDGLLSHLVSIYDLEETKAALLLV